MRSSVGSASGNERLRGRVPPGSAGLSGRGKPNSLWALGQTDDVEQVRALFARSLAGEMTVA